MKHEIIELHDVQIIGMAKKMLGGQLRCMRKEHLYLRYWRYI